MNGICEILNLCDKYAHRIDELSETILKLKNDYTDVVNANKSFIKRMAKQTRTINDLQKEIERLHKVFEIKDNARIDLVTENTKLKKEINELYALKNQLSDDNNNLRATIKSYEQLFY